MRAHSPSGGSVFSATFNEIRLAIEQWPSPAQRNATIKLRMVWGWANMNEIIARVLLFFAYGSIIAGTMGWFGNTHLVMR
jgi:hypothetical protein